MSTRATYLFTSRDHVPVSIYIHYDGYPSGAAAYLWAAHHHANTRGGMAAQFVRANDLAEFTGGHDSHGDTEYRYTLDVDTGNLTAWARQHGWKPLEAPKWRVIHMGPWYEFVNLNPQSIEGFTCLRKLAGHSQVWSADQLIAYVEHRQKEADEYAAKFPQYTGNIAGAQGEVTRLRALLAEYRAQGGPAPLAPAMTDVATIGNA